MKRFCMRGLVLVSVAASLTGCGNEQSAGRANDGGKLEVPSVYKQNCLSCHGSELQGRVGPNLQTIGGKQTEEQIYEVIQKGKGGMPAFENRLNEEEIGTLAAWLADRK